MYDTQFSILCQHLDMKIDVVYTPYQQGDFGMKTKLIYVPYYDGGPKTSEPKQELIDLAEEVITLDKLKDQSFNHCRPIYIGGDQMITLWTTHNTIRDYGSDTFFFYLDSHPDIHTWESSVTKNEHGMVLNPSFRLQKGAHYLPVRNIVFYGLKHIDCFEMDYLLKTNPETHSILKMPYTVADGANVHLTIDIDCMQLSHGVSYPMNSGFAIEDILLFIDKVNKRYNLVALELVEYIPNLDNGTVFNQVVMPIIDKFKSLT